jgi:hypothetical protein
MATPSPEVSAHLLQVIQAAHWLEWGWANPLRAEPFRVEGGMLRIPGVPGCGIATRTQSSGESSSSAHQALSNGAHRSAAAPSPT